MKKARWITDIEIEVIGLLDDDATSSFEHFLVDYFADCNTEETDAYIDDITEDDNTTLSVIVDHRIKKKEQGNIKLALLEDINSYGSFVKSIKFYNRKVRRVK